MDRFPFVVVRSVKAESQAAVADAKFMKASSISPRFTLVALPYPASPAVCSSYFLARHDYWKCALKLTHVRSSLASFLDSA